MLQGSIQYEKSPQGNHPGKLPEKLSEGKLWELDDFATLLGALVGAKAHAGPVSRGHRVGPWVPVFDQGTHEFVDQMGVGTTVPATLDKRQVVGILDRLGEGSDRFRQKVCVIRDFDFRGDFVFGFFGRVQNVRFAFDQRPFETLLCTVDVEALAVLAGCIEEESPDVCRDIAVFDFDMAGFDGVGVAGFFCQFWGNSARAEARDVFGAAVDES